MPDAPLIAHSLAEAYLYLMANPCPSCGKGPLRGREPSASGSSEPRAQASGALASPPPVTLSAECTSCHSASPWTFQLPKPLDAKEANPPPLLNPTDEPSRILDVAQWITLFRMISTTADNQSDKQASRRLRIEAGQCLEEALKFYEPDNDLPPTGAFFHQGSRDRLRANPEQFSCQRLLGLRNKLPTESRLRPESD